MPDLQHTKQLCTFKQPITTCLVPNGQMNHNPIAQSNEFSLSYSGEGFVKEAYLLIIEREMHSYTWF